MLQQNCIWMTLAQKSHHHRRLVVFVQTLFEIGLSEVSTTLVSITMSRTFTMARNCDELLPCCRYLFSRAVTITRIVNCRQCVAQWCRRPVDCSPQSQGCCFKQLDFNYCRRLSGASYVPRWLELIAQLLFKGKKEYYCEVWSLMLIVVVAVIVFILLHLLLKASL